MKSLNICVFCSASDLAEKYQRPAKELARLIAARRHTLIWGGSDSGLMGVLAAGVLEGGGKIVGVSVEIFKEKAHKLASEMIVTKDLAERKTLMLSRCDAIVIMVGGVGTLDEATDIIAHRKIGQHDKPIVLLDTDNFYDGLKAQLRRMQDDGFIDRRLHEIVHFANTPQDALNFIEKAV